MSDKSACTAEVLPMNFKDVADKRLQSDGDNSIIIKYRFCIFLRDISHYTLHLEVFHCLKVHVIRAGLVRKNLPVSSNIRTRCGNF